MKKIITFLMILCLCFSMAICYHSSQNYAYGSTTAKSKTTYVYWTKTGKKYHKNKKCKSLKRAKKIYKGTKTKAKKLKLTKCKICY